MQNDLVTNFHVYSHLKIMLSSLEMIERRTMPMHLSSVPVLEEQLSKWNSNALIEAYDAVLSESQKSSLMIEFLEENESHLLKEIDRDINSILEEQQGKKEFDLTPKREQALKLQAEVKCACAWTKQVIHTMNARNQNMHKHLLPYWQQKKSRLPPYPH